MIRKAFGNTPRARYLPILLIGALLALPAGAASTLTVTGTGAHCGVFGLVVNLDGANAAWVESDHASNDQRYVVRWFMKLNSLTLGASGLELFTAYHGTDGDNAATKVLSATLSTGAGSSKNLVVKHGAGLASSAGAINLLGGWHSVELDWQTGAGTGSLSITVDGGAPTNIGSLSNSADTVDFARWGGVGGTLAGNTGYLQLDDFVSQRTGPIGTNACTTPNDPPGPEPKKFFAIDPCRIYDSRSVQPGPQSLPLQHATNRDVQVTGTCNIPADAVAIAYNVTAVLPTGNGYLQMFPTGTNIPSTSSINFVAGIVRGNNGQIPLAPGGSGQLTMRPTLENAGSMHVVLDAFGYFKK